MIRSTICVLFLFFLISSLSSQSLEIDTLLNSGIKDNRINYAIANVDHATSNAYGSKSELVADIEELLERFDPTSTKAKSGFSHYRNFLMYIASGSLSLLCSNLFLHITKRHKA